MRQKRDTDSVIQSLVLSREVERRGRREKENARDCTWDVWPCPSSLTHSRIPSSRCFSPKRKRQTLRSELGLVIHTDHFANTRSMQASDNVLSVEHLIQEAKVRWLKSYEVLSVLQNFHSLGIQVSSVPAQCPPSGSLFLFPKRIKFRRDGIQWRRVNNRVREAHETLKVGDRVVLTCYYASSEDPPCFHRRVYALTQPEGDDPIVLVHYLQQMTENKTPITTNIHQELQMDTMLMSSPMLDESEMFNLNFDAPPDIPKPQTPKTRRSQTKRRNDEEHYKVMEMMGGSAQVHGHLAVINDFSPEWDYVDGGSKVLVTGTEFNRGFQYSCVFGDVEVSATLIQDGVLRCVVPPRSSPGRVRFCVSLGNFIQFSEAQEFEYRTRLSEAEWMITQQNFKVRIVERLEALEKRLYQRNDSVQPSFEVSGNESQLDATFNRFLKYIMQHIPPPSQAEMRDSEEVLPLDEQDVDGFSLLHCACAIGYYHLCLTLIASGADVNSRDNRGFTPFHWALKSGNRTLTHLLLPYVEEEILTSESELDEDDRLFLEDVNRNFENLSLDEISVVASRFLRDSKNRSYNLQSDRAASLIQTAYRKYKNRQRTRDSETLSTEEAAEIQRKEREIQAAIKVRTSIYNEPPDAPRKIQMAYRDHRQRFWLKLEKAAVNIQTRVRAKLERRRREKTNKREDEAARKIQMAFMRYKHSKA
ncbi:hypothetical protein PROFUN_05048 [Planoprotostelium fungivorum]|uniref:CG-1 domain-containing protein n=1 Tax=Planoprotostelium fungivorum TaxID=1890364 RepID=A0A2P6NS98_9EUKA|nr:hypothetical protein PROFUN_05048 [Planoprotostelium fungivorum]